VISRGKNIAKVMGTNTDITNYQYSAMAIRTCDKPITKVLESLFLLLAHILFTQRSLHVCNDGQIDVTDV